MKHHHRVTKFDFILSIFHRSPEFLSVTIFVSDNQGRPISVDQQNLLVGGSSQPSQQHTGTSQQTGATAVAR